MKRTLFIIILTLFISAPIFGQMKTSTVLATCTDIIPTGKRHNSFFFIFRVEKVLNGEYNDTLFKSKEFFEFNNAREILEKLNVSSIDYRFIPVDTPVILRFVNHNDQIDLLWICKQERMNDLENLENIVVTLRSAIINNQYEKFETHVDEIVGFTKEDLLSLHQFYLKKPDDMLFLREMLRENTGKPFLLYACSDLYYYTFHISKHEDSGNWKISRMNKVPKEFE